MFIFKMPSHLTQDANYLELQNRINFLSHNEPGGKKTNVDLI